MTDETDKKDDFDLDWDDALDDWERDVESDAVAKSGPMPQSAPSPAKPPAAPGRALYQPPDASEIAKMRTGRAAPVAPPAPPKPPTPTAPPPAGHEPFDLDDDDGATKIASIPRDLIARITGEPPAPAPAPAPGASPLPNEPRRGPDKPDQVISAVDLDLDGLLDGLDSETSMYPAEVPRIVRPVRASSAPPAPSEAGSAAPSAAAPKPVDATKPEPSKPNAATELARAVARAQPKIPTVGARPMPPIPRPGGAPAVPKPGLPGKPIGVPKPGEAKPAVPGPKPASPLVRPPGSLGAAIPKPAAPVPAAPPAPTPATASSEDDIDLLLSGLDGPAAPAALAAPVASAPVAAAPVASAPASSTAPASSAAPASSQAPGSTTPTPVPASPAPTDHVGETEAEDAFFATAEPKMAVSRSIEDDLGDLALDDAPVAPPIAAPVAAPPVAAAPVAAPPAADDEPAMVVSAPDEATPAADSSLDEVRFVDEADGAPADAAPERAQSVPPPLPTRPPTAEAPAEQAAPVAPAAPPEPSRPEVSRPEASRPEASRPDRGAQAARRSVRSRKPRKELFPLVGHSDTARRAQLELLTQLAEKSTGAKAARILATAADLAGASGDAELASSLRARARAADVSDVLLLRSARRDATARKAWAEVRASFEAEADLPGANRAMALAHLAELELGPLADPAAAVRTAKRALHAASSCIGAAVVEHDAAVGAPSAATYASLSVGVGESASAVLLERAAGRASERAGEPVGMEGDDVEALLSRARAALAEKAEGALAEALASLADSAAPPEIADVARRAAVLARGRAGDAASALGYVPTLEGASLPTLRAVARVAARAGDRAREAAALRAWAALTSGSERAAALARIADLAVDAGDLDQAEGALRDASLADASLGTLRIVRDRITRKDPARAGRSDGSEGALALSAKVALDVEDGGRELELLARARVEDDAPVTADVLSLDALAQAEQGGLAQVDYGPVDQGLLREIERTPADGRTPALLALADRQAARGDVAAQERTLRDARSLSPGEPVVVRALAALLAPRSPRDAAACWLEESSNAPDARAAFAASMAGRLLEGEAASTTHRRALDARRNHAPSIEALERQARATGDAKLLEEALDRGLALPTVPLDRAAQLVRLALVRAEDAAAAARTFDEARTLAPDDAVLVDLALRLGDALSPDQRAELARRAAAGVPAVLAPAYRLAHLFALEDAGKHEEAVVVARELAAVDGLVGRAAGAALDRIEIALGDVPLVAERRFAALRAVTPDDGSVGDEGARVRALEELASLDLDVKRDAASAAASLSAILEIRPQHLGALRSLERHAMEQDRGLDLAALEESLVKAGIDPADAAAHLRLAVRLRLAPPDAKGDAADDAVLAARSAVGQDLWTLRRVVTAAHAKNDTSTATATERAIAEQLAGPIERATYALRAVRSLERAKAGVPTVAAEAAELLTPFAKEAPTHGPAWEALADLHEQAGAHALAVDSLEAAAAASAVPSRKVAMLHRAAVVASDRADDDERALTMLEAAGAVDVAFSDVFERTRVLLERKGDRAKLSDLVKRRAAAGGDGAMLVELHLAEASLREADQDLEGAKNALRAALAIAPEKIEALRKLAQLSLAGEDYRTAADALIRIARVRKDRDELRWVFFTLGDIYDRHIPDPKRAEAAFLRVLKLDAEDLASMERLAELYQRERQMPQAAEMLERLAAGEVDPDKVRKHQLALANVLESAGDARKAEQVLEMARRAGPTELETLRALADFYGRQRAQTAHAMHLNRAVADFRHALLTDLADTQAWLGLVEILGWRGKRDAARAVASLAMAMGIVDVELAKLLDAAGGATGAGQRGADPDLDDVIAPPTLTAPTRSMFRLLGAALEKVLPFDPRTLRAEKLGAKDTALRPIALEIGRWMGLPDVEIWIAPTAGRVCMPVSSQPVALVVGKDLLTADERERAFLLARALRIARSQLTLALRAQPAELAALLAGLVLNFDPHYQVPMGVDAAQAHDFMKRVARQLPRRAQEEIGPVVFEMAGAPEYEPTKLALAVSELGDRAALLMTGNAPAAISALAKLAGEAALPTDPSARVASVRRSAESASLVSFALSDAHFEARHRAGLG